MNQKRFIHSIFFLILLLSLSVQFKINGQSLNWNLINSSNSTNVEGKINGLNMGGYANGLINMQSGQITVPNECNQCINSCFENSIQGAAIVSMQTKPNVTAETARLKPSILRFPGGTHSGWYHLYAYDDEGFYDAANPLMSKGYGMNLIEAYRLNDVREYCRRDSRLRTSENYIDGFINYIKNVQDAVGTSHQIEVTYVANLLTHFNFPNSNVDCLSYCGRSRAIIPMDNFDCSKEFSYAYNGNEALFDNDPDIYRFELYYKETQDAINRIVNHLNLSTNDVIYVEMGNEYYNNIGLTSGYPYLSYMMSANEYADLVELYAERLKCFFNGKVNLKVGIVTKPGTSWQQTSNIFDVNHPGLVGLLNKNNYAPDKQITLGEVIDAVIYHNYYTESTCLEEEDIKTRFNCAKDAFRNHIEHKLVSDLDKLVTSFPNQKIWITEWNMVGGVGKKNNSYVNTILHSTFVQEYALSLLEYNSKHFDVIEMAAHHRIGDDNLWSVVQTQDGDNEVANYRSGAYAMEYMSRLYEQTDLSYLGNVLIDNNTTEAKTTAFVQYCDDGFKHKALIYYSNKTDTGIPFTIPSEIENTPVIEANLSYLAGDHLFTYGPSNTTAGKNRFKTSNIVYTNSQLDSLGYGDIHDQFISVSDLILEPQQLGVFPSNSVGVLEVLFKNCTVNVNEKAISNRSIHVFPNPTHSLLNIELKDDSHRGFQLSLSSLEGKVVLAQKIEFGTSLLSLDLSAYPKGIYFISMINGKERVVKKIVIQ